MNLYVMNYCMRERERERDVNISTTWGPEGAVTYRWSGWYIQKVSFRCPSWWVVVARALPHTGPTRISLRPSAGIGGTRTWKSLPCRAGEGSPWVGGGHSHLGPTLIDDTSDEQEGSYWFPLISSYNKTLAVRRLCSSVTNYTSHNLHSYCC